MRRANKNPNGKRFSRHQRNCLCSGPCITDNCKDFCNTSSLHGLKFIGNPELSFFERLFFILAFIAAFMLLVNFILNVYVKWTENPVLIGIGSVPVNIKKIPFPAVTICNMNQARASKVVNITRGSVEFSILQTYCSHNFALNDTEHLPSWEDFESFTLNVSQPCSQMILSCKYGTMLNSNCSQFFKPVFSDEGLCCAFNTAHETIMYKNTSQIPLYARTIVGNLTLVDWTLEKGYPEGKHGGFYPQQAAGVGRSFGLNVILDAEISDYYCSSSNGPGFKVLLHNPNEVPNMGNYGILVKPGYETQFVIEPDISDASPVLRNLNQRERQCRFNNENNLQYFGKYLTRNCENEFEAIQLAKKCKCIFYYMPRVDPSIRICGIQDEPCYSNLRFCPQNESCSFESSGCLPGCFELKYFTSKTSSPLRQKKFAILSKLVQTIPIEYASSNMAIFNFYYIENAFQSKTKQQYVGITDFVANTGGLLSLFLGFSAISFVEIFYYLICKPVVPTRRHGNQLNNYITKNQQQKKLPKRKKLSYDYNLPSDRDQHFKQRIGFNSRNSQKFPYFD